MPTRCFRFTAGTMLSLLVLWLWSAAVIGSPLLTLPSIRTNTTSGSNASSLGDDNPLDPRLKTKFFIAIEAKVSATSTYMTVLKTLVKLSAHQYDYQYAGGTFQFEGYTNVKLVIRSVGSALQYRHAILGLLRMIQTMTHDKIFTAIETELYWDEDPQMVGFIRLCQDFLPQPQLAGVNRTQGLNRFVPGLEIPSELIDLANNSTVNDTEESFTALPSNSITHWQFSGTKIPLPSVFMTLCFGVVLIASRPGTSRTVDPFEVHLGTIRTELIFDHYGEPRTSPPFLDYRHAARALGRIPAIMFAEGRFEEMTFVLEISGIPVGVGFLRKY